MLNRFPHGIDDKSFVQKDWPHHPDWVRTVPVRSHDKPGKAVRHAVCNDSATLVWLADMACVEINQFLSTSPKFDWHDLVLVDGLPGPPDHLGDGQATEAEGLAQAEKSGIHRLAPPEGPGGLRRALTLPLPAGEGTRLPPSPGRGPG